MYPPKVFAVTFKRCSFARDFNYKALTEKFLVVWIDGRSERWIRRVLTNCEPASHASHASHHVSVSHARQMLVPVLVCAA